jgi:hypothetical protein
MANVAQLQVSKGAASLTDSNDRFVVFTSSQGQSGTLDARNNSRARGGVQKFRKRILVGIFNFHRATGQDIAERRRVFAPFHGLNLYRSLDNWMERLRHFHRFHNTFSKNVPPRTEEHSNRTGLLCSRGSDHSECSIDGGIINWNTRIELVKFSPGFGDLIAFLPLRRQETEQNKSVYCRTKVSNRSHEDTKHVPCRALR